MAEHLWKALLHLPESFFSMSTTDRLWPPFVAVAVVLGTVVYVRRRRRGDDMRGGLGAFLFPKAQYWSRSSGVDLQVFAANRVLWILVGGAMFAFEFFLFTQLAVAFARLVAGTPSESLSIPAFLGATVGLALMRDLATYVVHRTSHEWTILWPFHAVHHSAESLTPLTVYRKHPVYDLYARVVLALLTGPPTGIMFGLLGGVHASTVMAAGLAYFLFHITGSNLRHTHIWLSYGPALSRILVSPAMHQIHHSTASKHRNKNYGEMFALWDWAFGTLYVPEAREDVTYGLVDPATGASIRPHPTLLAVYLEPFRASGNALGSQARGLARWMRRSIRGRRVEPVPSHGSELGE